MRIHKISIAFVKFVGALAVLMGVSLPASADFGPNIYFHVRMAMCEEAHREYLEAADDYFACVTSMAPDCDDLEDTAREHCNSAKHQCRGVNNIDYTSSCRAFNYMI